MDAARIVHDHAGAERVKQEIDLVGGEEIVGRDLVGRGVVGLRQDLAEHQMRGVEPAETIDPRQQLGGDALHHPVHLAMHIGVQPAEIRHARRRPHAAEKTVAFDQQGFAPRARRSDGGRDPRWPTAEYGDFIGAVQRNFPRGFVNGFGGQVGAS